MTKIPLLSEHPRPLQFVLVFVLPALFGLLTGYFLGVSEPVYLILSIIGIVGGIGAGYDHLGAAAGAKRGVIAGSVFGASILIAHEIHGASAKAHLPEPAILLVVLTTVLAILFAALGGWLRKRHVRKAAPLSEPEVQPAPAASDPAPDQPAPPPPAPTLASPFAPASPTSSPTGAISLNQGSFEQFRSLGMSITQAKRVVARRDDGPGFSSVDDLDTIPGFSQGFLLELKQRLTV